MKISIGNMKIEFLNIKLILIMGAVLLSILWGAWFYFTSMAVTSGPVNITRLENADKIYSYSIYSDYYYRAISFDNKGDVVAEYSELIPTRINLGYDFDKKSPEPIVRAEESGKPMVVYQPSTGAWDANTKEVIKRLQEFSRWYGQILTLQNKYYLDEARSAVEAMRRDLFGDAEGLPEVNLTAFFEKPIDLAVDNIQIDVVKLDNIARNIKDRDVCPLNSWCPELLRLKFNQDDEIYFQYQGQYKNNINEYIADQVSEKRFKDAILVKTVRPLRDHVESVFFTVHPQENKIRSYFMDENGFTYVLVLKTQSMNSLFNNLSEYLKIAYGISFKKIPGFENKFAKRQQDAMQLITPIFEQWSSFSSNIKKASGDLPEKFQVSLFSEISNSIGKKWGDRLLLGNIKRKQVKYFLVKDGPIKFSDLKEFKDIFGDYPNAEFLDKIKMANNIVEVFANDIAKARELLNKSWNPFDDPLNSIVSICSDIVCVRQNNINGWPK